MQIPRPFYFLIASLFLLPTIALAQINHYKTPYSELKILEDTNSGTFNGENFKTRTYKIITSSNGAIVSNNIISLDEAANIKVIKPYTGQNLVTRYQNILSIKQDSYAVLARDNEVAKKYYYTLGSSPQDESIIKFAFSNGQYYTLQNTKNAFITKDGYIYDGNMKIKLENACFGPAQTSFEHISDLGIPIFTYLYKDSNVSKEFDSDETISSNADIVTVDGELCIRYTFVKRLEGNKNMKDMYFFDEKGNLSKYGYEYTNTYESRQNGTLVHKQSNEIALYDSLEFKTFIPDKKIFKISTGKKYDQEGYFILNLI